MIEAKYGSLEVESARTPYCVRLRLTPWRGEAPPPPLLLTEHEVRDLIDELYRAVLVRVNDEPQVEGPV